MQENISSKEGGFDSANTIANAPLQFTCKVKLPHTFSDLPTVKIYTIGICLSPGCLHGAGGITTRLARELGTGHLSSLALLRCIQANQLSRYSGAVVSLLIQIWWLPIERIVLNLQRNTACRVGPLVLWKVTRNRFLLAATCCHSAGKLTMTTDLDVCILQILSSHSTSSAMQKLPARLCGAIIRPWYWNVWDRIIPPFSLQTY